MIRAALILPLLALAGCVMGIPDAGPPPPKTRECRIWVRVDNGPWRCYSRNEFDRDVAPILFPREQLQR